MRYQVRCRCFFAIGLRNDCGGWELRSERFKGSSSPKQITTIDHQADKVIVFEGFMDFLSCLSMKHSAPLGIDAAVLNPVVNLPFLERHPTVHAFLDNDETGRHTLAELTRRCPRSQMIDHAYLFLDYPQTEVTTQGRNEGLREASLRFCQPKTGRKALSRWSQLKNSNP